LNDVVRSYVERVADLIRDNWYPGKPIDWARFRADLLIAVAAATTEAETHRAIAAALKRLGDGHSHLLTPEMRRATMSRKPPLPNGEIKCGAAWVEIPFFLDNDHISPSDFADRLQDVINELDDADPSGWIVDLRKNGGGNMWPMLAGLGPLLGNVTLGSFRAPDGTDLPWKHHDGVAFIGDHPICAVARQPYALRRTPSRIAVLIGKGTASSGEAVCIAFIGSRNARLFGSATAGLSSANETFVLSDGAVLLLTVSMMCDRTGRVYGVPIEPDVRVEEPCNETDLTNDAVLSAAAAWATSALAPVNRRSKLTPYRRPKLALTQF